MGWAEFKALPVGEREDINAGLDDLIDTLNELSEAADKERSTKEED